MDFTDKGSFSRLIHAYNKLHVPNTKFCLLECWYSGVDHTGQESRLTGDKS